MHILFSHLHVSSDIDTTLLLLWKGHLTVPVYLVKVHDQTFYGCIIKYSLNRHGSVRLWLRKISADDLFFVHAVMFGATESLYVKTTVSQPIQVEIF